MVDLSQTDFTEAKVSTFEPIPEGRYEAYIEDSEVRSAKTGNGDYLQVKWRIISGPFENRTLFDRYNIWNSGELAARIAKDQFHTMVMAVLGVPASSIRDTTELYFKPCILTVGIERDNKNNFQNTIKGYAPSTPNAVAASQVAGPASASPTAPRPLPPAASAAQPVTQSMPPAGAATAQTGPATAPWNK